MKIVFLDESKVVDFMKDPNKYFEFTEEDRESYAWKDRTCVVLCGKRDENPYKTEGDCFLCVQPSLEGKESVFVECCNGMTYNCDHVLLSELFDKVIEFIDKSKMWGDLGEILDEVLYPDISDEFELFMSGAL